MFYNEEIFASNQDIEACRSEFKASLVYKVPRQPELHRNLVKAVNCLILSGRNEEAAMDRRVEKLSRIKLISWIFFFFFLASLAFLQQVEMSWARTKLEIGVEENDSCLSVSESSQIPRAKLTCWFLFFLPYRFW